MKNNDAGYILIYDTAQIPDGMTIDDVLEKIQSNKICYYDSSKGAQQIPQVIHMGGHEGQYFTEIAFIDTFNNDLPL